MRDPIKQGPDLDLKLRQTYIGSSEWAVVAGLHNAYKSPYDVYMEKVYGYEPFDNLRMRFGRDAEPMIAKWVEEELDVAVAVDGFVKFHPKHDFLATNLDGEIFHKDGTKSILEIKTANSLARQSWGAELPIQYYTQIQGQMLITGLRKAYVAILTFGYAGPESFEIQEYDYNPEFAEMVVNKCVDFWYNHVVTEIAPDPSNAEDLKKMYPDSNGASMEASIELKHQIETLKELKSLKRDLEGSIKGLEVAIKSEMAGCELITFGEDTLATWKSSKPRKVFDRSDFQKSNPDEYAKYVKESGVSRTFRLK